LFLEDRGPSLVGPVNVTTGENWSTKRKPVVFGRVKLETFFSYATEEDIIIRQLHIAFFLNIIISSTFYNLGKFFTGKRVQVFVCFTF
jgi:hypothetical protein